MTMTKISLIICLPSALWLGGCMVQNTSPMMPSAASTTATIDHQATDGKPTSSYGDPNGVELVVEHQHSKDIPEPVAIGPAQALAIDAKHYARSYGIDHPEAMRQMLIQHDNQVQYDALRKEFGNQIASMGFITEPEYGILVMLTGTGTPPPDRVVYRPADTLSTRETVAPAYTTMTPEGIILTQADIDTAMALIESPTRFIVKFAVNPNAKNLTDAEKQRMYERSSALDKHIKMITGQSYQQAEGVYVIYVHETDAKSAGFNKAQLTKIGKEIMKMPVRIEWQSGYPTNDILSIDDE